ncbi:MAG: LamG domain-containing protein, partial [Candidatus Hydrogenedentes bacterium]|nr:LamG domain-containing protein [Candidatus Hydrogenedentota bacterium]
MRIHVALCMALSVLATAGWCAALEPPTEGVPFDGESAYRVDIDEAALDPAALTVSAWVKVRGTDASQVFVNRGKANALFTFYLYNGAVRMLVGHADGKYAYAKAPAPEPDTWVHYAGTYDGRTISVYRNGALSEAVDAAGAMATTKDAVMLGALDARERFLDGEMADIRLWRRALSADEVAAVANGGAGGPLDEGLVARWTEAGRTPDAWAADGAPALKGVPMAKKGVLINEKDDGYRGIWYYNQPSGDEYVYKYSGGLGTYCAKHIPHAWY